MSERIIVNGDVAIEWFPNIYKDAPLSSIRIELMHVRAANDISIEYSGERDGWVITQMVTTGWKEVEGAMDSIEVRKELAFIPAWDEDEVEEPS
jgi:hypothetical protein